MEVLSLGCVRTGTASIRSALLILGYRHTYHGLDAAENWDDFVIWEKAADATFFGKGTKLLRDEWDEMLAHCCATTDITSYFAEEMISTYPEAKVILVERNIDKWYKSLDEALLQTQFSLTSDFVLNIVEPMLGSRGTVSIRKMLCGFFRAQNVDEIRKVAKQRYLEHYETIRRIVPEEKLLNFKLSDGWGPLCAFLGRDIPDMDFPWVNETKALQDTIKMVQKKMMMKAVKKTAPVLAAVAVLGVAYYLATSIV
ncbi:MAG: hypothetical protein MMC33_007938 [Icmadophila ericetorum]|nr:hypothetical protein [Icmadophila ericetorum]